MSDSLGSLQSGSVLITGATGHLGARLAQQLVRLQARVKILARPEADLSRLAEIRRELVIVRGAIEEQNGWRSNPELRDVKYVFHLAAVGVDPRKRDPEAMARVNVRGTWNVLEAASQWDVQRLVYCGSCFEYGEGNNVQERSFVRPVSDYGVTKASGWLLANGFFQNLGLPVVCVRPFTFYGPQESERRLIPHVILSILQNRALELSDGLQVRDFVYVDEVVEALILSAVAPEAIGETINIASGQSHSVREVVEEILRAMNSTAQPQYGAICRRPEDVSVLVGNPEKAARILGWRSHVSLGEGLRRTIEWWREHTK